MMDEKEIMPYNFFKYGGVYTGCLLYTSKFPRNAMAFKWTDETAETTLREIEWSASRTGLINPVAVFDPVELEGTQVSRASVHNISIVESLKLGIGAVSYTHLPCLHHDNRPIYLHL